MGTINSERSACVQILTEVLEKNAFTNIALRKYLANATNFDMRSKAFITEVVYTTVRNLVYIDYVLNHFSSLEVSKMKPDVRNILRMSVCQMRFLEKVPNFAIINEAVELAKAKGLSQLAGFVNGVLRNAARSGSLPKVPKRDLALMYSYPKELFELLKNQLAGNELEDFLKKSHTRPAVTVFPNLAKTTLDGLASSLERENVQTRKLEYCLLVSETGDITKLDSFKNGLFFVMDDGAHFAVRCLGMKPGETLIDLAAAPGGKSFAAASLMGNGGVVLAYDIYPHKIKLIESGITRLGLDIVKPALGSALQVDESLMGKADAVLVDAPCSGLGTLKRHPEIKYRASRENIEKLSKMQLQMLKTAKNYLKPGGRLVYSTCTVTKEENEDVAEKFSTEIELVETVRLAPGDYSDGFFVAKYVK